MGRGMFRVAGTLGKLAHCGLAGRRLAPLCQVSGHFPSTAIGLSGASASLAGGLVVTATTGIGVMADLLVGRRRLPR